MDARQLVKLGQYQFSLQTNLHYFSNSFYKKFSMYVMQMSVASLHQYPQVPVSPINDRCKVYVV